MICYAIKNEEGCYLQKPDSIFRVEPLFYKPLDYDAILCCDKEILENYAKSRHLPDCKVVKVEIREVEDE